MNAALVNIGRVTLALVLSTVIAETVLRTFLFESKGLSEDPDLGLIRRPGRFVNSSEGYAITDFNKVGVRDTMEPQKAPTSGPRILFLGDSFVEAHHVSDDSTFVKRVQAEIPGSYCINAGRDGSNPVHHLVVGQFLTNLYHPSVTVIEVNERDFTPGLLEEKEPFHLKATSDGGYVTQHQEKHQGHKKSGLKKFVDETTNLSIMNLFRQRQSLTAQVNKEEVDDKPNPEIIKAMNWIMESYAKRLPNPILLYIPSKIDYFDRTAAAPWIKAELMKSAERVGIPFCDGGAALLDTYEATGIVGNGFSNTVPGSGHLNNFGHGVTAKLLLPVIERKLH